MYISVCECECDFQASILQFPVLDNKLITKTMALALTRLSRLPFAVLKDAVLNRGKSTNVVLHQNRSVAYSVNGAILPKPEKVSWGLPKVVLTVVLSVYIGGSISKYGAEFLEEHEIFVPDEDDD